MRWEGQATEREAERRLPGLAVGGVTRTFDAPEAMGVRFHEVEAKSALNHVPGEALPFAWTVNPYRGCSHACTYCMDGSTPILMGDGRTKPLAELRAGDSIYGTRVGGRYRHYVKTEVLDHWQTRKPAHRVSLRDGTDLIASGDHRFLTERGWKHVTGAGAGHERRPHATTNNRLIGPGHFSESPDHSGEYMTGYLTGMVRGDGHIGSYSYERKGRRNGDVHRFRLALADEEALARSREYLAVAGIRTEPFTFSARTERHREIKAIRNSSREAVEGVRSLIAWPSSPGRDWRAGFLAGIFDAEGSFLKGVLRISNTDPEMLAWAVESMRAIGIPAVLEDGRGVRASTVRVSGGLRSHLKFFHLTDPEITRKRSIEGTALKCPSELDVLSIEPVGTRDLYDITTGTGDFIADGIVSHNCFARPTHRYLDLNAREDFEREIVVKVNVPERLRAELARPSWKGELVALGTNTDPYQWVEGRYGLTRAIWEVMIEARNPASVLTKSPLLTRDIDLFRELNDVAGFQASLSIPTLDEAAWRATEPRTPHPRKRIEAVAELSDAGIPVGVLIAPLMPGINDSPAQVERILELLAEAGVDSVGGIGLHLKGEVREIFLDWLRSQRPDLIDRYEELYAAGAFLPSAERKRIERLIAAARRKTDVGGSEWRERIDRERARRKREVVRVTRRRPSRGRAGAKGADEEVSPQGSLF